MTSPPLTRFEYSQPKWGAAVRIVMYAKDEGLARRASDAVFARWDEMGRAFSDYDPESEISRLSRQTDAGPMTEPVVVSPDLFKILQVCVEAAELSDGTFDVTIGPLSKLWRRSRDMGLLPTAERLEQTRKSVGVRYLKLFPETGGVQLLAAKMRLDVDGLAAGYAVEEGLKVLKTFGIENALIDGSGEVAARGAPPGQPGWRVGIEDLEHPNQISGKFVLLKDSSVSTSGDTYRYVEINGTRYSHIIDPKTGLGLTRSSGSTVLAPDCTAADWLDTALPILGPVKGIALIERLPNTAARITVIEDGKPKVYESSRFASMLVAPGATSGPAAAAQVH